MIDKFVKAWDLNKDKLKSYFESTPMRKYQEYKDLVILLFDKVINPYIKLLDPHEDLYETINVIGDGLYSGTLLFIIHKADVNGEDYIATCVDYGSCSSCDTLRRIYDGQIDNIPSKKQVKEYMTLCLHLLQRCKQLYVYDDELCDYV